MTLLGHIDGVTGGAGAPSYLDNVADRRNARSWPRALMVLTAILFPSLVARSQTLELAKESASVACQLEGLWPASEIARALEPARPADAVFNQDRIMGLVPEYQTVPDSTRFVAALSVKQKWYLALKETMDPFYLITPFLTAAESQAGNQTPKYGEGWSNYGRRLGAAQLDFATQNFFGSGLLATILHQDPRYFRRGPQAKFVRRVFYSIAQLAIARQDSGKLAFNASNIGGTAMGIAASNLYYPSASRTGTVMVSRMWTSLMGCAVGNLMSEFWPDVQEKVLRKK